MPLLVALDLANRQSHEAGVAVIVLEMGFVEVAIESILIFPSRLVRNLQPCAAQVGIFEEVYIGALVEPVMRRVICWRAVEVVDITKERANVLLPFTGGHLL